MRDLEIPGTQTAVSNTHYKSFVFFLIHALKKHYVNLFFVISYNQFC